MNQYVKLLSKHRRALMGFAILSIMFFHFPENTGIQLFDFVKSVGYGGVDIFLFLSGFGLYFSLSKPDVKLKTYYKNRFMRVLPEFWIALAFVFLINMDFSLHSIYTFICQASTLGYWLSAFFDMPYMIWYISFIVVIYAIFPIFFMIYKKYGIIVPVVCISLVLLLVFANAIFFMSNKVLIPGMLLLSFARIPIFLIGVIFGQLAKEGCQIELGIVAKVFALICGVVALFGLHIFMESYQRYIWNCSLLFLPFVVIAPLLCVLLAKFFEKVNFIESLFAHFGALSLELCICHCFVIYYYQNFLEEYGKLVSLILIVILSFVFAYILHFVNKKLLHRWLSVWRVFVV